MTASAAARFETRTTGRAKRQPVFPLALRGGMKFLAHVSPASAAAIAEHLFLTPRKRSRPTLERDVIAEATPLVLPTEHGNLAAWQWDAGPCSRRLRALLVHGWEGRGSQFAALVEPLTAAGFRVVAFDAPAHGDSPGVRSSLFHFADAIERAAERFGPFHAIISLSMGAGAMLWASRHRPLAERVVMVAPPIDLRDFTRTVSRTLGLPEHVLRRLNLRISERFGVPIEGVRAVPIASTMRGALLVVHDENDREVPIAWGEALARAWAGAALVKTKGLGHQRILRDATTLETVVRFVAQGQADSTTEPTDPWRRS